ncbi:MAG: helix-turn-helix transcriptional regulator [Candidatus Gastranaerophilales bacterium]
MGQDARMIIAKNVKLLREKKSLKREKLSLLLGFDNSYISKLERGTLNVTIDKLSRIADILDVEIIELFKYDK